MGGRRSTKRTRSNRTQRGGCGCGVPLPLKKGGYRSTAGGYRSTKRDRQFLRLWKKGKSIGFTMRSSLKAKGLIPRSNGTRKVSPKYR